MEPLLQRLETSSQVKASIPKTCRLHSSVNRSTHKSQFQSPNMVWNPVLSHTISRQLNLCSSFGMFIAPFKGVKPGPKTFQVNVQGKTQTISIDRFKVAYTDSESPPPSPRLSLSKHPHKTDTQPPLSSHPPNWQISVYSSTLQYTCCGRQVNPNDCIYTSTVKLFF